MSRSATGFDVRPKTWQAGWRLNLPAARSCRSAFTKARSSEWLFQHERWPARQAVVAQE